MTLATVASNAFATEKKKKKISGKSVILTANRELYLQPVSSSYGHNAPARRLLAEPTMWERVPLSQASTRRQEAFLHVATAQP